MSTFGTRVLTDPVSQWFINKPLSLVANEFQRVGPISVAADSTKDVKGAWVEIVASTSAAANMMYLTLSDTGQSSLNTGVLLDIGIGSAGSESVVIENIPCGWTGSVNSAITLHQFPIAIPAGTRISARCQAFIASDTVNVRINLASLPDFFAHGSVTTIGAATTDSRGTNLPSNDTYVELIASTSQQYRAIVMIPCLGSTTNPAVAGETSLYTLGIGAAGSEVAVMTMNATSTTGELLFVALDTRNMIYAPANPIPQGIRIAVKQSIGRNYRDVIIYGVV